MYDLRSTAARKAAAEKRSDFHIADPLDDELSKMLSSHSDDFQSTSSRARRGDTPVSRLPDFRPFSAEDDGDDLPHTSTRVPIPASQPSGTLDDDILAYINAKLPELVANAPVGRRPFEGIAYKSRETIDKIISNIAKGHFGSLFCIEHGSEALEFHMAAMKTLFSRYDVVDDLDCVLIIINSLAPKTRQKLEEDLGKGFHRLSVDRVVRWLVERVRRFDTVSKAAHNIRTVVQVERSFDSWETYTSDFRRFASSFFSLPFEQQIVALYTVGLQPNMAEIAARFRGQYPTNFNIDDLVKYIRTQCQTASVIHGQVQDDSSRFHSSRYERPPPGFSRNDSFPSRSRSSSREPYRSSRDHDRPQSRSVSFNNVVSTRDPTPARGRGGPSAPAPPSGIPDDRTWVVKGTNDIWTKSSLPSAGEPYFRDGRKVCRYCCNKFFSREWLAQDHHRSECINAKSRGSSSVAAAAPSTSSK